MTILLQGNSVFKSFHRQKALWRTRFYKNAVDIRSHISIVHQKRKYIYTGNAMKKNKRMIVKKRMDWEKGLLERVLKDRGPTD